MTDQTVPALSEEDKAALGNEALGGARPSEILCAAVERIVTRHRQQAVREALAEVEALERWAVPLGYAGDRDPEGVVANVQFVSMVRHDDLRAAIARAKEAGA